MKLMSLIVLIGSFPLMAGDSIEAPARKPVAKALFGAYYTKISIWDEKMVHPYIVKKQGILMMKAQNLSRHFNAVFSNYSIPEMKKLDFIFWSGGKIKRAKNRINNSGTGKKL